MKKPLLSRLLSTFLIGYGIFSSFSATASDCSKGTNIAADAKISEYSSQQNTTNKAANLIDTNTSNRWSAEGFPQSAIIDLGDALSVNEVSLFPYKNRAYNFIVEGSTDGKNFNELTTSLENSRESEIVSKSFDAKNIRYVKLTIVGAKGYTGNWVSIKEFEVLCSGEIEEKPTETTSSCEEGSNLALESEIASYTSQQDTTNAAKNIIDGNTSNRWSAEGFPQNAVIDLGNVYDVDEISLFTYKKRAYRYKVEGSLESNKDFNTLVDATKNTTEATELNSKFDKKAVRYVKLTVTGAHNYSGNWISINDLQIKCAGTVVTTPETTLELSSISDFSNGSGSKTVDIKSNTDWKVTESSSWISISNGSGSKDGSFKVNVTENTSTSSRSENVTVTAGDVSRQIKIVQDGKMVEDQLSVSKNEFNTSETAKSKTVEVSSNTSWKVSESSSWLSLTNSSDSGNGEFKINISENSSTSSRSATVTVTAGDLKESITINQEGKEIVNSGDLDPSKAPSENFDLSEWYLSIPVDRGDGIATSIKPDELNDRYENDELFHTGSDGAMVFVNYPKNAPKTSANTSYSRCELRELLAPDTNISYQGVNKNNWVFGNSSSSDKKNAGGVDGVLKATLAVDHVTQSATSTVQRGRTIIGQIHASKNEPCRLYYHKLPNHDKGAIYVAHETRSGNETFHNMIGNYVKETGGGAGDLTSSSPSEPSDGIRLGEKFSYEIRVVYDVLYVTISREGKKDIIEEIDMSDSDYAGDWMYFKAGIYTQNKTCTNDKDYDKASFYSLTQTHNTSSSKELSIANDFSTKVVAYPNPFVDQLSINTTGKAGLGYAIRLLNTNGSVLKMQSIENDIVTLNVADIANGLHILQIVSPNNEISENVKVIKN